MGPVCKLHRLRSQRRRQGWAGASTPLFVSMAGPSSKQLTRDKAQCDQQVSCNHQRN